MPSTARTIVVQSFRTSSVPEWISRCLKSVRDWASLKGHDYAFWGDEVYDLCGPDYLSKGFRNPQALTNLARLILMRRYLSEGYSKAIWLDADVFVFDPKEMNFDYTAEQLGVGYAFGKEIWMYENGSLVKSRPHNAISYFTQDEKDLDMLISLISHIGRRGVEHNFQVGVRLLAGLQYSLGFKLLPDVAMFSPALISAICNNDVARLTAYGQAYGYPACAANLCLSLAAKNGDADVHTVMDILQGSEGAAINRYAPLR